MLLAIPILWLFDVKTFARKSQDKVPAGARASAPDLSQAYLE